ncbi:MAG: hypothetical protein FD127_2923 [Acidimicrobiaceae bacterium]|nr:MAG: hypothetical protein FD127_2923 [Acidimicrobiaceae bacterium]
MINIVLAVVLVDRYGVLGLAASFAIAYALASIWALQVMSYRVPGFSVRVVAAGVWKMALAAVVMAEAMWLLADRVGGNTGVGALLRVAFAGTAGIAIYLGLLVVLRVPELHELRTRISSRFT